MPQEIVNKFCPRLVAVLAHFTEQQDGFTETVCVVANHRNVGVRTHVGQNPLTQPLGLHNVGFQLVHVVRVDKLAQGVAMLCAVEFGERWSTRVICLRGNARLPDVSALFH